jgi:hypothetical protein
MASRPKKSQVPPTQHAHNGQTEAEHTPVAAVDLAPPPARESPSLSNGSHAIVDAPVAEMAAPGQDLTAEVDEEPEVTTVDLTTVSEEDLCVDEEDDGKQD